MIAISVLIVSLFLCSDVHGILTKHLFNPDNYADEDIITRDVAVIGGGSSGTYGAFNLRWLGQSVVLVEKEPVLGGHTNTYTDPTTGVKVDYGVQAFWNISTTREYFAHLNISIVDWAPEAETAVYADFQTGHQFSFQPSTNFTLYAEQWNKYPYLGWSWDLPYPVPEDLLLSFQSFIDKYGLQDIAYSIYFNSQGLADILSQPTIAIMKIFDGSYIDALAGGDVVTANHDNSEIYTTAQAELGADALLCSTVIASQRQSGALGIQLVVKTPSGNKLIQASKLLISIPPLLENMAPFDLSTNETDLFSQWTFSSYYTMLIRNTGLPSGYRFMNAVQSNATENIPYLPAPYQITETRIPGLFYVWYGSPYPMNQSDIVADVTSVVLRLASALNSSADSAPQLVEFRSHTPFKMNVEPNAISGGFYAKLEDLQGQRNTWYTGAAFLSQSSGVLWNFTNTLLPKIIAA